MVRLNLKQIVCGLVFCACSDNESPPPPDKPPVTLTPSMRNNLRFKGPERLNADIAAALELPADAVCTELGQYQCTALVHNVALGGVDPYGAGLYERTGFTGVTTPLVVERLAWSACTRRVEADLANATTAVVFRGVPLNGVRLANPAGPEVSGIITQLTQRVLQREPQAVEVSRYVQLAKDIEASGASEPARAFMQALCFAVVSSSESVFY